MITYAADWEMESVLIASGSDVLRMSTDHVGGLIDDVIFSTSSGDDVITAVSYDSLAAKLYVGVRSVKHDSAAGYIARGDLQSLPATSSR